MEGKEVLSVMGKRLREVREIFNEGGKVSTTQFAYVLSETRDRISNYENGRSAIPVKLLYELYNRGINPTYIITGDGEIFANNEAGNIFKEKIRTRISYQSQQKYARLSDEKTEFLKVAAGMIPPPQNK